MAEAAEQLAAPAAAGAAVISANEAVQQAEEEARTTSDWCATCEDPNCRDQGEKIRKRVEELRRRNDAFLMDEHGLFTNHYERENPLHIGTRRIGSWMGHVDQFEQKQKNLRTLMEEYQNMGCPEFSNEEAEEWATRPPPDGPATG